MTHLQTTVCPLLAAVASVCIHREIASTPHAGLPVKKLGESRSQRKLWMTRSQNSLSHSLTLSLSHTLSLSLLLSYSLTLFSSLRTPLSSFHSLSLYFLFFVLDDTTVAPSMACCACQGRPKTKRGRHQRSETGDNSSLPRIRTTGGFPGILPATRLSRTRPVSERCGPKPPLLCAFPRAAALCAVWSSKFQRHLRQAVHGDYGPAVAAPRRSSPLVNTSGDADSASSVEPVPVSPTGPLPTVCLRLSCGRHRLEGKPRFIARRRRNAWQHRIFIVTCVSRSRRPVPSGPTGWKSGLLEAELWAVQASTWTTVPRRTLARSSIVTCFRPSSRCSSAGSSLANTRGVVGIGFKVGHGSSADSSGMRGLRGSTEVQSSPASGRAWRPRPVVATPPDSRRPHLWPAPVETP